jgi:hypothetical protein
LLGSATLAGGRRRAQGAEEGVGGAAGLGGLGGPLQVAEEPGGDGGLLALGAGAVDELDRGGDLRLVDPGQELDERGSVGFGEGDEVLVALEEKPQTLAVALGEGGDGGRRRGGRGVRAHGPNIEAGGGHSRGFGRMSLFLRTGESAGRN